jgi:hypothetical protein
VAPDQPGFATGLVQVAELQPDDDHCPVAQLRPTQLLEAQLRPCQVWPAQLRPAHDVVSLVRPPPVQYSPLNMPSVVQAVVFAAAVAMVAEFHGRPMMSTSPRSCVPLIVT